MLIFMQLSTQLYIDGKWVNGASTMPVTDPADESVIANVQISSEEQCIQAVDAAHRALKVGQRLRPCSR